MHSIKPLRLMLAVFALFAMLAGAGIAFGQDDGTGLADTGTPGLTNALDNLNLPPVPPSNEESAGGTPSPTITPPSLPVDAVCTCTPATPVTRAAIVPNQLDKQMAASVPRLVRFGRSGFSTSERDSQMVVMINSQSQHGIRFVSPTRLQMLTLLAKDDNPAFQSGVTFSHDDFTVTVTEDGQIKVIADDGTVWFSGQAGVVGIDRIIIQGTDDHGYQYAISDGYFMANTPDGDVLIDNGKTTYIYDYDKRVHSLVSATAMATPILSRPMNLA